MAEFRPKNAYLKSHLLKLSGVPYTITEAYKVANDDSPYVGFSYTTDPNPTRILETAYKVTFSNGEYAYLDADEVVL